MMGVPCEFFGGPLAGQVHSMPYPPQPTYRVPSFPRVPYAAKAISQVLSDALETEEYELGPGRGSGGCAYSYTWINPAVPLREEIARLRDTIERQHAEKRNLERENRSLSADAGKWRSLKSLVGEISG